MEKWSRHVCRQFCFQSCSIVNFKVKVKTTLKIPKGNRNRKIEEEQKTQWPKEKVQTNKQRSTKHTHKTKDRVTRTPLKTGGELEVVQKSKQVWSRFFLLSVVSFTSITFWIDSMQLFTESIIVQLQNIIYKEEAGIKDSFMKKWRKKCI